MRASMTPALILAYATAWAQNPNLVDYTFMTGQDASKWIPLSGSATQMIGSGENDANSSMTNIGFDFTFGDGTYTQFWTSSNAIFSFNLTQAALLTTTPPTLPAGTSSATRLPTRSSLTPHFSM